MWYFCEIFYGLSSTFTKLAGGTLLLRLTTNKLHTRIIWFIMVLAVVFGIAFDGVIIFQCRPIEFFWSPTRDPSEGRCVSASLLSGFTYAHAVVTSIGDWTFGILPYSIVRALKTNFRTKLSVALILCLANIGSIATLVRIKTIHQIQTSHDFLFATVDLAIWSGVEIGTAIPAASIATLRPLFRKFLSNGTTANSTLSSPLPAYSRYAQKDPPANFGLHELKQPHVKTHSQSSTTHMTGGAAPMSKERPAKDSDLEERLSADESWRMRRTCEIAYREDESSPHAL